MTIGSTFRSLVNRVRSVRLGLAGGRIAGGCRFGSGVRIRPGIRDNRKGEVILGPDCSCEEGVILDGFGGRIEVGRNVFLGPYVVIYGHGGVSIGDQCLIAMHCRILSSNHTIAPFGTDIRSKPDLLLPTRIGRDVWLGAGVTVLGGVSIGDGCVVGAGAVVTRDLPAGAIARGVPARIAGNRHGSPPSAG
jgi:acetyltransferase-like isoleucine patch superfamily enzyme